ncbi:MAG: hypothetical protein RIC49_03120 [Phycisphaerales bacterium]
MPLFDLGRQVALQAYAVGANAASRVLAEREPQDAPGRPLDAVDQLEGRRHVRRHAPPRPPVGPRLDQGQQPGILAGRHRPGHQLALAGDQPRRPDRPRRP